MPGIPEEKIEQVREATDIVEVVSRHVSLKKAGANFRGLCPFHQEKTPSFMVSPAKQIYHCFGCGEGGNAFRFLMKMENLTFVEAVKNLAQQSGIALPRWEESGTKETEQLYNANKIAAEFFHSNLLETGEALPARQYLAKRGVTDEIIEKFQLGFSLNSWDGFLHFARKKGIQPDMLEKAGLVIRRQEGGWYDRFRNRLMFPIGNYGGKVIGFGGRALDDSEPKYMNSPETQLYQKNRNLYAWHLAKEEIIKQDRAIIVEGYFDAITAHQFGFPNTVAGLGTALTAEQARLVKRCASQAIIAYDVDAAGQKASFRGFDILIEQDLKVRLAKMPAGKDPDDFIRQAGHDAFEKLTANSINLIEYKFNFIGEAKEPSVKASVVNELIVTLAKIPNEVEKRAYVSELADKLKLEGVFHGDRVVDELGIWSEIDKVKKDRAYFPVMQAGAGQGKRTSAALVAERDLLQLMMGNSDARKAAIERLKPENFQDNVHKELFVLLSKDDFTEESRLSRLVSKSEGTDLGRLITALMMEKDKYENPVTGAMQLIKSILDSESRKRMKELKLVKNPTEKELREQTEIKRRLDGKKTQS